MPKPVKDIPALLPFAPKLTTLGYGTLEQLVGAANTSAREHLSRFLAVDVGELISSLPVAAEAPSFAALKAISLSTFPTGVLLGAIPRPTSAFDVGGVGAPATAFRGQPDKSHPEAAAAGPVGLPGTVNHIASMSPIRNQESRGTCVAFATLAAYEHFVKTVTAVTQDFSEQYLYWKCKQTDGYPSSEGTWVAVAYTALNQYGVCLENTWPYNGNKMPANESQDPPPVISPLELVAFRVVGYKQLAPNAVGDIKAELARGRCVTFSVPVFSSWYQNVAVMLSGDITMPIPGEIRSGGHAMCLVGYEDNPVFSGGGRFLLRNSWGTSWATNSSLGTGYGTIPYAYIASYAAEAYSIS